MDYRVEIPESIVGKIELPASKSITARALIINAMTRDALPPTNIARCDDSEVMARALSSEGDCIDVADAGTAMRFLTAYYGVQQDRTVTIDGSERMRERPIGPLVDALRRLGAEIEYIEKVGFPPLKIKGRQLHGCELAMRGDVSSQFISAVLMIAPVVGGMTLRIEGDIVSRPYIDMTLGLMRHCGIAAKWTGNSIKVPAGNYTSSPIIIEGDWSAASYWLALNALLPESRIELSPLHDDSLQGDRAIVELMEPLGVRTIFMENRVELKHQVVELPPHYHCDMASTPDLVPTMAVTLCLMRVPFSLTGVRNLRIKESDRLEVLRKELEKLGYTLVTGDDSVSYDGNHSEPSGEVVLDPHGDHRMAMALSLAASRHNIIIKDAEVVTKSYPDFWSDLTVELSSNRTLD
jgi:3-phosphoshikimate 1-carboxyvinyltransferase